MTATTSNLDTRHVHGTVQLIRRLALGAGSVLAVIGSAWSRVADAGQMGPSAERDISRHTGARI
ncbi:MAG: hypothetical protein ACRDG7_02115 [Candidatus Limnocylindria bacterium]